MVITIAKKLLNPISLPGMGKSIELNGLTQEEVLHIHSAFSKKELFVEFTEEQGHEIPVTNLWANPHALQVTLFV